ncbi:O-antigen ligase family protein [Sciscionella sediminilitoris]|uniref:O-antigen ligase family protein n=1 Tax=Sciscionella sediminilitoris TaxID=1445613 RepID=UPI0004DFAD8A|nr:O-antigen ligase family protein [Sciscionella sp. SE31]
MKVFGHPEWLVRALTLLLGVFIGAVVGGCLGVLTGSGPSSSAQLLLTAGPKAGAHGLDLGSQARYVENFTTTVTALAPTATVREAAGARIPFAAGDRITAESDPGTELVRVTVSGGERLRAKATAAAEALAGLAEREQPRPDVLRARVSTTGGPVEDHRAESAVRLGGLGAVLGLLGALLLRELRERGGRIRREPRLSAPAATDAFATELNAVLACWWRRARTLRGAAVGAAALFAVFGYGLTGSWIPPLAVALLAGYRGLRDPRFAAASVCLFGFGPLPTKIETVRLGPVTPTVLEIAILLGLLCTVLRPGTGRNGFPVRWQLGLFLAVLLFGALVGFTRGGDPEQIIESVRALGTVLALPVLYRAFTGRFTELLALLLLGGAAAAAAAILAAGLGLAPLLADERTQVLTGSDASDVSRLNSPVLMLCGPLLILLCSGLVRPRRIWVFLALFAPVFAMEALSFNRSTWGPLLAGIVLIAGLRGGLRGIVRRGIGLIVLGGLVLGIAFSGALGRTGDALAERVNSLVSGAALAEDSLTDRLQENSAAWSTLGERPLLGTGLGVTYGGTFITYDDVMSRLRVDDRPYMHNQYLRIWLSLGLAGLFAFGALGVRAITVTAHSWRARAPGAPATVALGFGLALVAAVSIFQTTLIAREYVIGTAVLLAALLLAARWIPAAEPHARAHRRARFAAHWRDRARAEGGEYALAAR